MSSLVEEQVLFTTADGSTTGGISVQTIEVTNITVDNLVINTSLSGTAIPGGLTTAANVQTLTNKTIVGGSGGNDISANKLRGVTISTTAPTNGQVLLYNSGTTQWEPTSQAASVTSVSGGTGVNITGGATTPVVNLSNTTVTAGTYAAPNVTYDAQGRATAASNILTTLGDIMIRSNTGTTRFPIAQSGRTMVYNAYDTTYGITQVWPVSGFNQNVNLKFNILGGGAAEIRVITVDGATDLLANGGFISVGVNLVTGQTQPLAFNPFSTSFPLDNGSTLGTTNNYQGYIYVYALSDGGQMSLGCSLTPQLMNVLSNPTILDGVTPSNNNNASVLYSNVAGGGFFIQYLGKIKAPQVTAGVWLAAPTEIWVGTGNEFSSDPIMTTRGDLITMDSNKTPTRLALGTANKFLTTNGSDPSYTSLNIGSGLTGNGVSSALTVALPTQGSVTAGTYTGGTLTINNTGITTATTITGLTYDNFFAQTQSIPGTTTNTIILANSLTASTYSYFGTANTLNKATGIFTMPANGTINAHISANWATNTTGYRRVFIKFLTGGTTYVAADNLIPPLSGTGSAVNNAAANIPGLTAGDTVWVEAVQNSGSTLSVGFYVSFTFVHN